MATKVALNMHITESGGIQTQTYAGIFWNAKNKISTQKNGGYAKSRYHKGRDKSSEYATDTYKRLCDDISWSKILLWIILI